MDEPLKEVALLGRRRAPGVLELLVRREVLAAADQLESTFAARSRTRTLSVFDLDVVGAQLDREVELVLARAHVVLPAVPRAGEDAALEVAVAERALQVEAVLLHRVEAAVAVSDGDLLVAGLDRSG